MRPKTGVIPCIWKGDVQDRSRRGRSSIPGPAEAVAELDSPRVDRSRPRVRTVEGTGSKPGRIAQGGIRSAHLEGKMGGQGIYVGVDVSKERLDVAVRPNGEFFSEANDKRAVSRLVKRLKALDCTRVVVEATGGYET